MTTLETGENIYSVNGVEIHVCQIGDPNAPPLLMIHGIHDRWESWTPIIHELSSSYNLFMPDLRGHGRSSKPERGYELSDYAADIDGVIQALGLQSVLVVGHSLGALTAAYLAADYPQRVRAAVLEDPPASFNGATRERMQRLLDAKRSSEEDAYSLFQELHPELGEERWQDQASRLLDTADGPFESIIAWAEQERSEEIAAAISRVHCPTLLLQADPQYGGVLRDADAATVRSSLSNGELRSFEGTGHSIHKERPREFADTLIAFLGRYRQPSSDKPA